MGISSRKSEAARALDTLEFRSEADWETWLRRNHARKQGIWLVFSRKGAGGRSMSYDQALDDALAFGWIDSIIKRIDARKYARMFSPRRPWSIWSGRNIARVNRLIKEGRMTEWGLDAFVKRTPEISLSEKLNAEGVRIPQDDFEEALIANRKAWANFNKFTPNYRKKYFVWIAAAKKAETRKRRIAEAVDLISRNVKALLK